MEDWQDLVWRMLIGLLVIFIGGGLLGGLLSLTVTVSPKIAGLIFCPEGSIAIVNPDLDQRTPDKQPILCRDQNGVTLPPIPDAQSMALQRKYFYTPGYTIVSLLVIGWFLSPVIQKMVRINRSVQKTSDHV